MSAPSNTSTDLVKNLPDAEDYDALVALRSKGFGWISPNGRLAVCTLHDHFQALADLGIESDRIKKLSEDQKELPNISRECTIYGLQNIQNGTHIL